MKLLTYPLFLLAPMGQLSAAVNAFTGLTPDAPLTTAQTGWTLSETNPSGAPLAFVGLVSGDTTGALGGEFGDIMNAGGSAKLTMTSSLFSPAVGVSMDMLIKDSTNTLPTRDTFGFGVANAAGASIVELSFLPVAQTLVPNSNMAQWQLSYLIAGAASSVLTSFVINEQVLNSINIIFANNGVQISIANSTTNGSYGGTISSYTPAANGVGNLAFNWTKGGPENGDNTMYFDNIGVNAVPEPGVLAISGLAALLILKRRRH